MKAHPSARRVGGSTPAHAVDGRGEGLQLRGTEGPSKPARPLRGPPPAERLPRHGPEVTTYAEGGAYPERACVGCSFVADQVADPAPLNARDTSLAFVSRAPQANIEGLKARMGWEVIRGTR